MAHRLDLERLHEALGLRVAAAKARGVRLGNPNGTGALRRAGADGAALRRTVRDNADAFARDLAPVVAAIRADGATSLRAVAAALEARGIRTRRGGRWRTSNVADLLARLERLRARAGEDALRRAGPCGPEMRDL